MTQSEEPQHLPTVGHQLSSKAFLVLRRLAPLVYFCLQERRLWPDRFYINLARQHKAAVHAIKPLDHSFSAGCAPFSWQYAGSSPTDRGTAPEMTWGATKIPWMFGRRLRGVPRIEIGALHVADGIPVRRCVCSSVCQDLIAVIGIC